MAEKRFSRRSIIATLGSAVLARSAAAVAQQTRPTRRIGVLMTIANDHEGRARMAAFRSGLAGQGWIDGRNLQIDFCWTDGDHSRISPCAAQLVRSAPDAILASTPPALTALRQETNTIPIVFVQVAKSFADAAHPKGNVTGSAGFEESVGGKWIQFLHEIAPRVRRVGVLVDPEIVTQRGWIPAIQTAAQSYHLEVTILDGSTVQKIESSIDGFAGASNGLIVLPSPPSVVKRKLVIALAAKNKLPAIYTYRFFVADGGLISYGNDVYQAYRGAGTQIGRILHGTPIRDLPVLTPIKLELAINLRTAKALGLKVPRELIIQADKVIE
ncbi:MAG: ABC transporter substrate-binding protein [Alphaproteobacteria bacterium]|nr:ABC transporter substrate-binding protein [Alphaproteobacteria bacterium]